ncbi:hypothetical protein Dimus_019867 [Dionaea muscipula]
MESSTNLVTFGVADSLQTCSGSRLVVKDPNRSNENGIMEEEDWSSLEVDWSNNYRGQRRVKEKWNSTRQFLACCNDSATEEITKRKGGQKVEKQALLALEIW